jgi:hypothetical protein
MYLGNQPALSYTSFAKQDFTTSATTSYTLDHPVTNENEIALFINFVRQEPTTAYTATNTSLTLTSATSASDDMYCVFLGKAVQTVNPPNGSVGASQISDGSIALGKLSATGTKDATTFLRGDNSFAVPAGGTNTPAFKVRNGSDISLSNATATKVTLDTESFDTDNAFASDKFTVPSGKAGKYFLSFQLSLEGQNDVRQMKGMIYKNGSAINDANFKLGMNSNLIDAGTEMFFNTNGILDLAVGDYVEAYVYIYNTAGGVYVAKGNKNFFQGYRIIE